MCFLALVTCSKEKDLAEQLFEDYMTSLKPLGAVVFKDDSVSSCTVLYHHCDRIYINSLLNILRILRVIGLLNHECLLYISLHDQLAMPLFCL